MRAVRSSLIAFAIVVTSIVVTAAQSEPPTDPLAPTRWTGTWKTAHGGVNPEFFRADPALIYWKDSIEATDSRIAGQVRMVDH
jgi:hypothetical protein